MLLSVKSADWRSVASESAALRVPPVVRRQASVLAIQLRRLRAIFDAELQETVAQVFRTLLEVAIHECDADDVGALSERPVSAGMKKAQALLTLRSFMIVWWTIGTPWPRSFPKLRGCGFDPAHPIAHNAALVPQQLVADLARQRAWNEAVAEHKRRTLIDDKWLREQKKAGLSNDDIAALIGCSHETVA